MPLLEQINAWVQKGFDITYYIIDQVENGYLEEVRLGNMPNFTYTFVIAEQRDELWLHSVDSLEEGFELALEWLVKNK